MSDKYPDGVTDDEAEALKVLAKEELRKRLAALRRTPRAEARAQFGAAMCQRVIAHPAFEAANTILSYAALRFEINPCGVVEEAARRGKAIALTRMEPATRQLALHLYRPGDPLVESGFVVEEPLPTAPLVAPEAIDLVLVPGLAFDARGFRLGYGQGYYDRLLPRLTRARRMGLAYELSLLVEVPSAPHDQPVDYIVTERRVLTSEPARALDALPMQPPRA